MFSCKITIYKNPVDLSTYLENVRKIVIMEFGKSVEKSWSNQQTIGLTAYLKKMKGEAREKDRIDYIDSLFQL